MRQIPVYVDTLCMCMYLSMYNSIHLSVFNHTSLCSKLHDNGAEDLNNEREIVVEEVTSKSNMRRNFRNTEVDFGILEKNSGSMFLTVVGSVVFGISLASSMALPFVLYYKMGK